MYGSEALKVDRGFLKTCDLASPVGRVSLTRMHMVLHEEELNHAENPRSRE